jgi:hypothetical protein
MNEYKMSDKLKAVGSKAEVFHGTAKHTSGYLYKSDLMHHNGRIISRKKHAAGKKAIKHLFSLGYKPKKGTFKLMRKSMVDGRRKKTARHTRRQTRRGGAASLGMLSHNALSKTTYGTGAK